MSKIELDGNGQSVSQDVRESGITAEEVAWYSSKWSNVFAYSHLPAHLQAVSVGFSILAVNIFKNIKDGPEKTVALRKLLEAKDAAVRAVLFPSM